MATTPILSLPVSLGVDNTYWVPVASTTTNQTTRVGVQTISGIQQSLDYITATQGSLLFRGVSEWEGLTPGTAGYVLSTQGPDADPQWVPNTAGSVTSVDVSGGSTGLTTTGGPITSSGTITIQGTLSPGSGGTGFSSYTAGDIIYASGASTLSKLADVAIGSLLASGGSGVAPAWSSSPSLSTSLTTPLVIGGTAASSSLTLKSTSGSGTTDYISAVVGNNGAIEVWRATTGGLLGVGTNSPLAKLSVSSNSTAPPSPSAGTPATPVQICGLDATASVCENNAFGGLPSYTMRRSGGTNASKTAVVSGDTIGQISWHGYNGTSYPGGSARIRTVAVDNFSVSQSGAYIAFDTTQTGTNTQTERIRVGADGVVTLGVSGTNAVSLAFSGSTSGAATISSQAVSGTPTLTLPNSSGTFAVSASSPLSLDTTTGNLTLVGAGDVVGPASATSGNVASYNGTTGKLIADSGVAASNIATLTGTQTLTNKTINLTSNTLTGTAAQFNTACSDADLINTLGGQTINGNLSLSDTASFKPQIVVTNNTDDAFGPYINFGKTRASGPAIAGDSGGTFIGRFADSGSVLRNSVWFSFVAQTINAGSVDGYVGFTTTQSGSTLQRMVLQNGLRVGSPTGSDKGAGTINVSAGYYVNDVQVPSISGTATLTNKTIALGSNTVSGTIAQFNTALSDGDFTTLAGTETLTNKTLDSLRTSQTASSIGTGVKTISNAADSTVNFGKYFSISLNGTTYYVPCGTVAPT